MSNVVKMAAKKKQPDIPMAWQTEINKLGDKLADRIYDAIRLADEEANDKSIHEEFADCSVVGVLVSMLVLIVNTRDVLSPDQLLALVQYEIERQDEI